MRSELTLFVALAGACATPNTGKICHPVSSWAAPAYECAAPPPPAPPPPKPEPPPPPPPEPPKKAEIKAEKIELKEKVEFDTDSDVIKDQSKGLLDEVVGIMKDHPEITKVEIQGHTDSQGSHGHNMKLSDARAASVRKYLEEHGVDGKRLTSKGYGPDKPIADNGTDAGRAENRRVEVHIIERSDK
jgi:outer membrane protein OmpA-like peptidoglycan-associated protein